MQYLFTSLEILDVVDGSRTEPDRVRPGQNDTRADERKKFIRDNGKAMHLISTFVDRKVFETISMCTTAHNMWDRLSLLHEQKSQYSLQTELQTPSSCRKF